MAEACTLDIDDGGTMRLSGPLTFATTPGLYRQSESRLAEGAALQTIDLEGVSRVDSAGLALLLEWQARRRAEGSELAVRKAPAGLVSLARLCEAVELLNLTGRTGSP